MSKNICKYFVKNNCKHGDQCKFVHDSEVCKNYFLDGTCKRNDKCKFKHTSTLKKVKNTENFKPNYDKPSMNILVGIPNQNVFYKNIYTLNDVIIVPNFLNENTHNHFYDTLLKEINDSGIEKDKLWKSWHGENHLIADDNLNWKDKVPTFQFVIDYVEKYFNMNVKSTRFNYYQNSSDWKPFHHDAAAIKENIAKNQNFTVGISFGATRDIAFEKTGTKTVVSIPLPNNTAYAFSKDVNINWKHGVPQIDPSKSFNEGRISIIAWGKVNLENNI